ncbi:mechanosensitive ion channel family protein [Pelagibius sp.]|uniref:mechanosensitive ion channel family protein n=1 Tax=Pelagibius sp. TaxID=1931238 RepID=UPI002625A290|nr:mechanosensitive ion channel domain-containing protein [Pelagibius sp.]
MEESVTGVWDLVVGLVTSYGLSVIGAIVILIVGFMVAGWVKAAVTKALSKVQKVDETLRTFFASLAYYAVVVFTVVAVLAQFGIETTSFIAVLGAAGLAIGLALQGTLSNVAAGVMLLLFRPFKIGDYIEGGGLAGTVKSITLFVTELATPDNVQIIAPNSQLWGSAIKNYSFHATRRVDLAIGIAYEDEIDRALAACLDEVNKDSRVHADPAPMAAVTDLGDSSVNLVVRIWCNAADYWGLKFDMTKNLKNRMDVENISIPYPQRMVHTITSAAAE